MTFPTWRIVAQKDFVGTHCEVVVTLATGKFLNSEFRGLSVC